VDVDSLATGRCACPGYSTERTGDTVGVTDIKEMRLRPPKNAS
jgi:hypothetical protein